MIVAVVLAAGTSSRFGEPKQLLELEGKPLLQHAVDRASAHFDRVLVVVGHEADRVSGAVSLPEGGAIVHNPDFAAGQQTSISAGLAAVERGADVAITLGDQPFLSDELIAATVQAFLKSTAAVVRPRHGNAPGHPVLVRASGVESVAGRAPEDIPGVMRGPGVQWVDVPGPAPADVDTRDDYDRLRME